LPGVQELELAAAMGAETQAKAEGKA